MKRGRELAIKAYIVNHLLQCHDIRVGALLLSLAPTQQDGEIEQGHGEGCVGLVLRNVHTRMSFAQLLSLFVDEQAHVGKLGRLPAKGVVHGDVLGGRYQPFLGTGEQLARWGTSSGEAGSRRTAPRMTWVIFMCLSSTTLAKW
jgi:hypothetical protein